MSRVRRMTFLRELAMGEPVGLSHGRRVRSEKGAKVWSHL